MYISSCKSHHSPVHVRVYLKSSLEISASACYEQRLMNPLWVMQWILVLCNMYFDLASHRATWIHEWLVRFCQLAYQIISVRTMPYT